MQCPCMCISIYNSPRYVGLRRRCANRFKTSKKISQTNMYNWQQNSTQMNSHREMIEHATCELFQVIPIGSTFFIEDNGEKSQDCMLDAQGDRLWFPVHPKPPPVSSKCTGTWILVLLQFFKRGSLKSKRESLSEGLL